MALQLRGLALETGQIGQQAEALLLLLQCLALLFTCIQRCAQALDLGLVLAQAGLQQGQLLLVGLALLA